MDESTSGERDIEMVRSREWQHDQHLNRDSDRVASHRHFRGGGGIAVGMTDVYEEATEKTAGGTVRLVGCASWFVDCGFDASARRCLAELKATQAAKLMVEGIRASSRRRLIVDQPPQWALRSLSFLRQSAVPRWLLAWRACCAFLCGSRCARERSTRECLPGLVRHPE